MTDYDLVRRCDVLEILDYEGFLGRTRKLVEQLVAVTPEAQAAEIERLRGDLKMAVEAGVDVAASLSAAISLLQRGGKKAAPSDKMFNQMLADYNASLDRFRTTFAELTGSATVKDYLTTEDEKQSHEWKCPIDYPGCRKNCGSYGCGN